jgi:hypothetical protein
MSGDVLEDMMTPEEYDAYMRQQRHAFKEKHRKYSLEEVHHLLNNYRVFAETVVSAQYEQQIVLPNAKDWFALNG